MGQVAAVPTRAPATAAEAMEAASGSRSGTQGPAPAGAITPRAGAAR